MLILFISCFGISTSGSLIVVSTGNSGWETTSFELVTKPVFSTLTIVSADDDRSYYITQAFIDLTVENNGLLHVDEQYDYTFDGKFNGVYRDIPLKPGESIENIQVWADGAYPEPEESASP